MRKAELSLETMTPVGRNDSICRYVFSLGLNDSRSAAFLICLHGLQGVQGARANVIVHAPKPQTMHGLRDPGSRSAATPGASTAASFSTGFFSAYYATVNKRQLRRPRRSVALSWEVALLCRKKWWRLCNSMFKTNCAACLHQCNESKELSELHVSKGYVTTNKQFTPSSLSGVISLGFLKKQPHLC